MQSNSFSQGVAPGGLRDKADIKLLICYILKTIGGPLSRTQINEALNNCQYANYFELNQAITELIEGGQVVHKFSENDDILTADERTTIEVLRIENSLPITVREKVVNETLKVVSRDKIKDETKVEVEKLDHGYNVTFTIFDVDTKLLQITLYVDDNSNIELLKKNFINNAVNIYSDILSALTTK